MRTSGSSGYNLSALHAGTVVSGGPAASPTKTVSGGWWSEKATVVLVWLVKNCGSCPLSNRQGTSIEDLPVFIRWYTWGILEESWGVLVGEWLPMMWLQCGLPSVISFAFRDTEDRWKARTSKQTHHEVSCTRPAWASGDSAPASSMTTTSPRGQNFSAKTGRHVREVLDPPLKPGPGCDAKRYPTS